MLFWSLLILWCRADFSAYHLTWQLETITEFWHTLTLSQSLLKIPRKSERRHFFCSRGSSWRVLFRAIWGKCLFCGEGCPAGPLSDRRARTDQLSLRLIPLQTHQGLRREKPSAPSPDATARGMWRDCTPTTAASRGAPTKCGSPWRVSAAWPWRISMGSPTFCSSLGLDRETPSFLSVSRQFLSSRAF